MTNSYRILGCTYLTILEDNSVSSSFFVLDFDNSTNYLILPSYGEFYEETVKLYHINITDFYNIFKAKTKVVPLGFFFQMYYFLIHIENITFKDKSKGTI